jgi:hypothetical protein
MVNETREEQARRKLDLQLDEELEDTFPASDALQITLRKPDKRTRSDEVDGRQGAGSS